MAYSNVNSSATFASGASTTIASAATSLTSGNLILVQVRHTGTVSTVADTAGNTYTLGFRTNATGLGTTMEVWYCINATGHASNVVTVTFTGSISSRGLITAQFSGSTTCTLQVKAGAAMSGTSGTTWTLVTAPIATALVVGSLSTDTTGSTWTAGSGFSTVTQDASTVQYMEWRDVSTQTSVTVAVTGTTTTSKNFVALMFAEPSSGGGAGGAYTFVG